MSNDYKIITVSTIRGERFIEVVEQLKARSLEKAIELTRELQIAELQMELNVDQEEWTEEDSQSYTESVVHETEHGIAFLECGDQHIKVIVEETNEWYKLTGNHKQWDGATWAEWNDLLNTFW